MEIPKMGGMRGFPKSRLVTLVIPNNNNSQISFPDQPDLRYARILGIETFTSSDLTSSIPDQIGLITAAQLPNIALTLETNDADEWYENETGNANPNNTGRFRTTSQNIKWQPLVTFHRIQNGNSAGAFVRQLFEFNNIFVTWEKSFISLPANMNTSGNNIAACFQVYYTFRSIYGKMITRT